jgi:single-strand DNA-binding protein
MARSINRVTLLGNLGRDAETRVTPGGLSLIRLSVGTTRSWKSDETDEWKEETNWTTVVLWRQEKLAKHLVKGKQLYVEGRLSTHSYEKDGRTVYVTEVVADQVILLGGPASEKQGRWHHKSRVAHRE